MCLARRKTQADKDHNKDPSKPKVTTGIVAARFREDKRPWKRLVERLHLTAEDKQSGVAWGHKWKSKSAKFWGGKVLVIDNKNFTCRTNAKGRLFSHTTRIRGAYLGRGVRMKITKPSKLKHREGQGNINVLARVGNQCQTELNIHELIFS
jgi:hypothetical protein